MVSQSRCLATDCIAFSQCLKPWVRAKPSQAISVFKKSLPILEKVGA